MLPDGRLRRRGGAGGGAVHLCRHRAILTPALFADGARWRLRLTHLFDRAEEEGRLFGLRLEGVWMHVGTPEAVAAAEAGAGGDGVKSRHGCRQNLICVRGDISAIPI